MRGWLAVLAAVLLVGMCMAEPHIVDADEWNTTARDLAEGNDPRQPDKPTPIEPASPRFVWGVVGVVGLIGLALLGLRLRKRRAKR